MVNYAELCYFDTVFQNLRFNNFDLEFVDKQFMVIALLIKTLENTTGQCNDSLHIQKKKSRNDTFKSKGESLKVEKIHRR